jgi:hypothetical protein
MSNDSPKPQRVFKNKEELKNRGMEGVDYEERCHFCKGYLQDVGIINGERKGRCRTCVTDDPLHRWSWRKVEIVPKPHVEVKNNE